MSFMADVGKRQQNFVAVFVFGLGSVQDFLRYDSRLDIDSSLAESVGGGVIVFKHFFFFFFLKHSLDSVS